MSWDWQSYGATHGIEPGLASAVERGCADYWQRRGIDPADEKRKRVSAQIGAGRARRMARKERPGSLLDAVIARTRAEILTVSQTKNQPEYIMEYEKPKDEPGKFQVCTGRGYKTFDSAEERQAWIDKRAASVARARKERGTAHLNGSAASRNAVARKAPPTITAPPPAPEPEPEYVRLTPFPNFIMRDQEPAGTLTSSRADEDTAEAARASGASGERWMVAGGAWFPQVFRRFDEAERFARQKTRETHGRVFVGRLDYVLSVEVVSVPAEEVDCE